MTGRISAFSYVVQKFGTVFVAVAGDANFADISGTDVTTVTQNAINTLTTGSVYIKQNAGTPGILTHKPGVFVFIESSGTIQFLNGSLQWASSLTVTSVGVAGGASELPLAPSGYVTIAVGGANVQIPYYNVGG